MSENHKENGGFINFDFRQSMTKTYLVVWKRNIDNIDKSERTSLEISKVGNKTKYFVTTNEQGQLVASDGKNALLLEGAEWEVPAATLEILNKPIKPPATGLGKK